MQVMLTDRTVLGLASSSTITPCANLVGVPAVLTMPVPVLVVPAA